MSAFTLFDLTYRLARELGVAFEGTATAGAANNITDTVWLLGSFDDDYFNAGTAWILYDAAGGGAAPEGQWARISDFDQATGVATLAANLTAAVGAGDRYAICNREYTLDQLISSINSALSEILIPIIDVTTIETDTDVTEYTLPTGVLDQNIRVSIQRNGVISNNYWIEYHDWYIQPTATGTAKTLVFNVQPPEPWDVKLEYWLPHPELHARTDKMAESININRIVAEAALKCLMWKKAQKSQDDPVLDQRIAELNNRVMGLRAAYPNRRPERKLATLGMIGNFDEDIN